MWVTPIFMAADITTAAATKAAGIITKGVPTAAGIITMGNTITGAGMNTVRVVIMIAMIIIDHRPVISP
jgi:hypothetical protein